MAEQASLEAIVATSELLAREKDRRAGGRLKRYFLAEGPYRRELYPKHLEFFRAGATHRERLLLASNRVGKTDTGLYESVLHLTGLYPDWWEGRRFAHPVRWWVCGDTSITIRDILQSKLLGPPDARGTGFLPAHTIQHTTTRRNIGDAVDQIWVKHVSGGLSVCQLKTYEQGREAFQGTSQHGILEDEEPPEDVHSECLLRTAATSDFTGGILLLTFTPLRGLTPLVNSFLQEGSGRWFIQVAWEDVPHLTAAEREDLWHRTPPYLRDARFRGVPQLGAGAIYPFPESEIKVPDFEIPSHWPRGFGLDAQPLWKSHVVGALDRDTGTLYITQAWKREQVEPVVQAEAIKAVAPWLPGVGDASGLVSDSDRRRYIDIYRACGLNIELATKAVESGIQEVYDLLASGQLKVFQSCHLWFNEYGSYHRNDRGRIVKQNDHCLDSTRYLVCARGRMATPSPKLGGLLAPSNRYEGPARPYAWMAILLLSLVIA